MLSKTKHLVRMSCARIFKRVLLVLVPQIHVSFGEYDCLNHAKLSEDFRETVECKTDPGKTFLIWVSAPTSEDH